MSAETKEQKQDQVREIKTYFHYTGKDAEHLAEKAKPLDRELSQKIHKVQQASEEVVKHITERQNG